MSRDIEKTADGDVCIPIVIQLPKHFTIQTPLFPAPGTIFNLLDWSSAVLHDAAHYSVMEAAYMKSHSPLQHEYIRLVVRLTGTPGQEPIDDPIAVIRIERNIRGNGLPGWIGLWGTADDTVMFLGAQASSDHRLHSLRWEGVAAPPLLHILALILHIKRTLAAYWLAKTSCYPFAKAIFVSINNMYSFNAQLEEDLPRWYSKECCLLGIISAGSRRAQRAAERATQDFRSIKEFFQVGGA